MTGALAVAGSSCLLAQNVEDTRGDVREESAQARELLTRANASRRANNVTDLLWDDALADAARKHCMRMANEPELSHRYAGEPDLTSRSAQAGAHFSAIEENIAVGSRTESIHKGWLDSPEHKANLLNKDMNRVGIAVFEKDGLLFAVEDFAKSVSDLTLEQVEDAFAALLRERRLMVSQDSTEARQYCRLAGKYEGNNPPRFLVRWQNSDVTQLPPTLLEALAGGSYHKASVGSCPPHPANGPFTTYRIAVFLY